MIKNHQNLQHLCERIRKKGSNSLHILSDFDRTLTYGTVNGKSSPSIISALRNGNYLTEDYAKKAHALFDKYYLIETDTSISEQEKKKAMKEWWEKHIKLLINSGLSKADLEDIISNGYAKLRDGIKEFMEFLYEQKIPIIIFSASGCGEVVQMFLEKEGVDYPNIFYVTNKFEWNEKGRAKSVKGEIIHSMNKDETVLQKFPEAFKAVKNRKNIILLGDMISDLGMAEGFDYENIIKIGFLNPGYKNAKEKFTKSYDITLEGNSDFSYINSFIRELTKDPESNLN